MRTTRLTQTVGVIAIFAAGAATTFWAMRARGGAPDAAPQDQSHTAHGAPAGTAPVAAGPVTIDVSPEQLQRAGVVTAPVEAGSSAGTLRLPGMVQPNAYTRVSVTSFVSGRVTRVPVVLGQHVRRGDTIAEITSPDLADARARYLAARADVEAGELRLERTERLAALGSASRQELEDVRAQHTRHDSELEQAAARLRLLRVDPANIVAAGEAAMRVSVAAPRDGVVIERPATEGMAVEPATAIATIADLSPVWVIADVHERDLARVRLGVEAVVTMESYPGVELRGRVTYIAPDVRPETRTTQVRVEVRNDEATLKFGMFVTVRLQESEPAASVSVPRGATQALGARTVVYVADPLVAGRFTERAVVLGAGDAQRVTVVSGVAVGERVASAGTFALRAEAEKLGRARHGAARETER